MSRIAKKNVRLVNGLKVWQENQIVLVEGPKGKIRIPVGYGFSITEKEGEICFQIENPEKKSQRAFLGLYTSLIKGAIEGVLNGFSVDLELVGIGYKAQVQGKDLILNVGYSNPVTLETPEGLEILCTSATQISVKGIEKPEVTAHAAKIRGIRPPEPYKGKGIRYSGEVIKRKAGKAGK